MLLKHGGATTGVGVGGMDLGSGAEGVSMTSSKLRQAAEKLLKTLRSGMNPVHQRHIEASARELTARANHLDAPILVGGERKAGS
jgi:hypothetical protein